MALTSTKPNALSFSINMSALSSRDVLKRANSDAAVPIIESKRARLVTNRVVSKGRIKKESRVTH